MRSAEEAQKHLEDKLRPDVSSASSDQILTDYVDWWLANRASSKVAASTAETYESHLRTNVLPALGTLRLSEIRPAQINAMADGMRRDGKAAWTIRGAKTALASVLATAVED